MKFHLFNKPATEALFKLNNIAEFEQLWTLDSDWFEEPNYRRNGWSGVIKYALKDETGNTIQVFIKRQENHNHRTLLHPIKGVPTFRCEYKNLKRLKAKQIPSLHNLYYGERIKNDKAQSILITQSLEAYQSFEDLFFKIADGSFKTADGSLLKAEGSFQTENELDHNTIARIMQIAGENIRQLHDENYRHGSLYPNHFFVKVENQEVDVRLIDLEKLKWFPLKCLIRFNDLSRFIRRRTPISQQSLHLFIDAYLKHGKDLSGTKLARKLYALLEKT